MYVDVIMQIQNCLASVPSQVEMSIFKLNSKKIFNLAFYCMGPSSQQFSLLQELDQMQSFTLVTIYLWTAISTRFPFISIYTSIKFWVFNWVVAEQQAAYLLPGSLWMQAGKWRWFCMCVYFVFISCMVCLWCFEETWSHTYIVWTEV